MALTTKEAMERIGKKGSITVGRPLIDVEVTVMDYKNSYGQERWLVQPIAGSGQAWVESVNFDNE